MDENHKFKRSYRKWSSMCRRCYDPGHPAYKFYGGQGIQVDPEWLGRMGYTNFVEKMGEPPEGLTLERIDRSKNYGPDNCRWATWEEQAKNRTQGGFKNVKKDSIRQKAFKAGLPYPVVYTRIKKLKWTEEKALSTPVGKREPSYYSKFLKRMNNPTDDGEKKL